ncbi:hypothetical protein ACM55K_13525 [Flavobacterium sp. LT1R49]|uniref:hypothetical protein n=1 Tax=Flavobacterium arabinosi TaxID=3398737 RepID=UPI003A89E04F
MTEERIEEIVDRLYTYDIHNDFILDTHKLCKFISSRYPITFDFTKKENGILGKSEFNPLKIYVNPELEEIDLGLLCVMKLVI